MKVIHIATSITGGAGIGMMRYHQALLQKGLDSRIITRDQALTSRSDISSVKKKPIPKAQRLLDYLGIRVGEEARMRYELLELDDENQYELFSIPFSHYPVERHPWIKEADIINLHWVSDFLNWPSFFQAVNKPIVLTLHDQQPYLGGFHYTLDATNNPHLTNLEADVRSVKKTALSSSRMAIISNSQWNADAARESKFFPADTSIETIYYPLNTEIFQPRSKTSAKETFCINPTHTVIGFACENLDNARKGFTDLLEALALLPISVKENITLFSFGKELSHSISQSFCIPWVHIGFLNTEAAQAAAYSAIDIFVIPSRAEAFGQTALEAISCGTRVIGSKAGGIREALLNSPNSLLYNPGDIRELANCLTIAIKEQSSFVSEPAYTERIRKSHSFSQCADSHIKVYSQLLA